MFMVGNAKIWESGECGAGEARNEAYLEYGVYVGELIGPSRRLKYPDCVARINVWQKKTSSDGSGGEGRGEGIK